MKPMRQTAGDEREGGMEEANDGVAPSLVLQSVAARHRPEGRVAAPLCRQLFAAAWLDRRPTVTAARSFVGGAPAAAAPANRRTIHMAWRHIVSC